MNKIEELEKKYDKLEKKYNNLIDVLIDIFRNNIKGSIAALELLRLDKENNKYRIQDIIDMLNKDTLF